MTTVRQDAPWCPSNLEFIRRINDLPDEQAVWNTVFDASYLVMGLGDVYLGAPVATPLDPRHRLVTTKYNPARTWTAENSVGIGGAYLCVYGMEGPGGYQFVGRTLQMWNRYREVADFAGKPWLLRFFDQLRFYPVSAEELLQIRRDFPLGRYPLRIEHSTLRLAEYQQFLRREARSISAFREHQQQAFNAERDRWIASGQAHFDSQESAVDEGGDAPLRQGEQGWKARFPETCGKYKRRQAAGSARGCAGRAGVNEDGDPAAGPLRWRYSTGSRAAGQRGTRRAACGGDY